MPDLVDVPIAELIVDARNARLKVEQSNEQAALLAIATQQGKRLLALASDIIDNGLDPLSMPAIVPTDDQRKRYIVIEGNRRVAALRALDTPSLVAPALDAPGRKRLNSLSMRFAKNPIDTLNALYLNPRKNWSIG